MRPEKEIREELERLNNAIYYDKDELIRSNTKPKTRAWIEALGWVLGDDE